MENKLNNQIIISYRNHLQRLGYSKTSVQMLPNCLKEFLEYTKKEPGEIRVKDILDYKAYLEKRPNKRRPGGLSESYIGHHIYSIKVFYVWKQESGEILDNPMSGLKFKKANVKAREILTKEEIKTLYEITKTAKEKALLSLFYGCGLRRTEGEKLNLKDIKFRAGIIYIREGKGKKRRAIPMSKKVKEDLKNYAYKERPYRTKEIAFIINKTGSRTRGSDYNLLLKKLIKRADIKKEITLHCLRHSIATHLLEAGLSVEYVREFLGHKHLESTQIYTRISQKQINKL